MPRVGKIFKKRRFVGIPREQHPEENVNEIIHLHQLNNALMNFVCCKHCGRSNGVSIRSIKSYGLASELKICCQFCQASSSFMSSPQSQDDCQVYDVNTRFVYAMRSLGSGMFPARAFCSVMDLPQPPTKITSIRKILLETLEETAEECMAEAVNEAVEENGDRDLTIAIDGSWQKRGHQSMNGVVTATSIDTNKVLDIATFSKACRCPDKKNHTMRCNANFFGTSGAMEVEGAVQIYERSEAKNVRYVNYLGDGDSRAFQAVENMNFYGDDCPVRKLECLTHVQKRMGTRLRTFFEISTLTGYISASFEDRELLLVPFCQKYHLVYASIHNFILTKWYLLLWKPSYKVADPTSLKKATNSALRLRSKEKLGGRNGLTDRRIQRISKYYGLAIRQNQETVEGMQNAIWAVYKHLQSKHHLCPNDGWCKAKKGQPHVDPIPGAVMKKVKPIFQDLTKSELLKRCLHGGTQNANESFNHLLWTRIPKSTFCHLDTLRIGVYDAVCTYNCGSAIRAKVLKRLGVKVGSNFWKGSKNENQKLKNRPRKKQYKRDEDYAAGAF